MEQRGTCVASEAALVMTVQIALCVSHLAQIMVTSTCYVLRLSTRHTSTHYTRLSKHPPPPLHKGGVLEQVPTT